MCNEGYGTWFVSVYVCMVCMSVCLSVSPSDNTWLGFGLSGSDSATLMIGADATIVWVDREDQPHAEDYYLSAYIPVGLFHHHTLFNL